MALLVYKKNYRDVLVRVGCFSCSLLQLSFIAVAYLVPFSMEVESCYCFCYRGRWPD